MKNILSLGFTLFLAVTVFAAGGTETLTLKTSAVCGGCKVRIESAVKELPGIKTATVDLTNGSLTVEYRERKISADDIKLAVSMAGYSANEVAANPESYEALPACCKGSKKSCGSK
ncbi:MAG: heavy metal transporter [Saprospirales bacterium]|nr:heavy metal transporter [Saprospirales bacterium]|tara:strand:+ start:613 stop:960 length:348 start_codon:yes stop_codon:yes gene_type:complete